MGFFDSDSRTSVTTHETTTSSQHGEDYRMVQEGGGLIAGRGAQVSIISEGEGAVELLGPALDFAEGIYSESLDMLELAGAERERAANRGLEIIGGASTRGMEVLTGGTAESLAEGTQDTRRFAIVLVLFLAIIFWPGG